MKKVLILFILLVLAVSVKAQFPNTATQNNVNTLFKPLGGVTTGVGFIEKNYTDSNSANLNSFLKQYAGATFFSTSENCIYVRNANATGWIKQASGSSSSDWQLTGNSGTTAGTNFIGTTDLRDLTLKTNNIERLRAFSGGSVRVKDTLQTNYLKPASDTTADYEIVVLPDIQGMTYFHPDQLYSIGDWIKTNAVTNNIKAVLALGDLTDNSESFEWLRVDTLFKKIDSANIPYFPLIGNHDYDAGDITSARLTTEYNTWFGTSRFAGKSWYGNALNDLTENSYIKFNVGETKYLVIGLEVFPKDSSLDWAGRVVDSFPEYKTIIITHAYMSSYGELSNDTTFLGTITYSSMAGNNGQAMWDKFVKKHKNIMLVMNGHFINNVIGDHTYSQHFSKVGDYGNEVRQIMVNYQRKDNGGGYNNGGGGYFMRLRFSPANNKVYVSYYSSFYNTFDPDRDSFDLDVPNVQVNSTLSLKRGLLVREDVTVNGGIYSSLPQYSLPYIGINGKIRDTGFLNFKGGIVTVPKLKSNVTGNDTLAAPFSTSTITAMENNNDAGVKVLVGASAYDTRPLFFSNRSRGTINSPSNVQNGDFLMGIVAGGVYGGAVAYSAGLEFVVDGTPTSSTNVPGAIDFKTGTYGGNRTTQMRIKSDGKIGIGTLSPDSTLQISGGFKLVNGSQGAGKVLTSDAGGGATWQTPSGGGITVGATTITSGTNTRIGYNNSGVYGEYAISGTGNVAMSASPTFTGLPQVNAGTIVYPSTSGYNAFSSASGASTGLNVTNTASNGYIQLNFAETTSLYGGFYKWNSTYGGNYTGTSLPFASSFQLQSGAGNDQPIVVSASALITQIGSSGSNKAYRMDGTGLKIGTNADIHTSGTESLDVTGNGLFTGTVNATSGFNGTVGATTRNTGAFTTGSFTGDVTVSSGSRIAVGAQETGVDLAISKAGLGSNLYMWTHSASVPTALLLLNDASTKSIRFQLYPTSYSTSGMEIADNGALFSVGMPFNVGTYTNHASDFWTNNVRRGGISGSGAVDFTGAMRLSNYGAGTATFDASGNITSVSDERLKTAIKPYTSGLKQLLLLKPIQYKWNEKSGNETKETYAGFSAQNVKNAIPYGTGENKDGYLSLQERAIVATLVNAVKEQQQMIDELKREIIKLQQK